MVIPFANKGSTQCDNIFTFFRKFIANIDEQMHEVNDDGEDVGVAIDIVVKLIRQVNFCY